MGAALTVLLLAVSAAPASAGFRYVPPETDAAQAEVPARQADARDGSTGAAAADIEPAPVPGRDVSGTSVSGTSVSGTSVWRVHAGERLREVLARWGVRADVEVLFLTDRGWRLDGAAAFEGGFMDAVQALFRGLSHLPHAPAAARSEGGTALVVTHRLPAPAEGGGKP